MPEDRISAIRAAIEQIAGKPAPADNDESLFDSGILDSFALADLVAALELAFSTKVPDSDVNPRKFDSVSRINAYFTSK